MVFHQVNFRWGRSHFRNDYDVIDAQSTMICPFCYDQFTNSGGSTFYKVVSTTARQKNCGIFFIKRFTLTMDPILIVLLKHI